MYNIETGEMNNFDENENLAEIRARSVRAAERKKTPLKSLDNKQKLDIIKRWYPSAYRGIREYYPVFLERPDDFPKRAYRAVNAIIMTSCHNDGKYLTLV